LQGAQREDTPRLGDLFSDVAAAPRRVDGDPVDVEGPAVEQDVGERVLVVELVVGVGIDEDAQSRRRLSCRPCTADGEHQYGHESGRPCPECLHGVASWGSRPAIEQHHPAGIA
jgi:hypothetical protein